MIQCLPAIPAKIAVRVFATVKVASSEFTMLRAASKLTIVAINWEASRHEAGSVNDGRRILRYKHDRCRRTDRRTDNHRRRAGNDRSGPMDNDRRPDADAEVKIRTRCCGGGDENCGEEK